MILSLTSYFFQNSTVWTKQYTLNYWINNKLCALDGHFPTKAIVKMNRTNIDKIGHDTIFRVELPVISVFNREDRREM